MTPDQLQYAKTHEWVFIDESSGERIATVGISSFAVEALTDLVYIELPEVGRQVTAGASLGEIESVKAVSDLYSPVTGEVVEINHALASRLEILNDDPYGEGWMVKIKLADDAGLGALASWDAYQQQCAEEGH